jgi:hypothetical protein
MVKPHHYCLFLPGKRPRPPILKILPTLPILRILPVLPILSKLPALPTLSTLPKLNKLKMLKKLPILLTLAYDHLDFCHILPTTVSLTIERSIISLSFRL